MFNAGKVAIFYATKARLGLLSALTEAWLYRYRLDTTYLSGQGLRSALTHWVKSATKAIRNWAYSTLSSGFFLH